MSRLGVFSIPNEFKSEDKWFRYFNRKQAAVLVACGIVDYRIFLWANMNGILIPSIILMLFSTITVMGIVMIHLPVDALFLTGGGITIDQLLFRLLYRRLHREIFTKNYQERDGGEL